MRFYLVSLVAVALVACSSAEKKETTTTTATTTTEKAVETPVTETKTTTTSDSKKVTKTESSETTTNSTDAGLPAITGTEKSSVTCTNKADTRKISVLTVNEGGCGVVYNKMGSDKTVAMAKSMSYCDTVSSKIKTNLEGAGFNCGGAPTTGTSSDQ